MRKSVAALVLIAIAAGFMVQWYGSEDTTCHGRIRPGPNSNTSRLDTTLDIPRSEWPAFAQILRDFATANGWSVREGPGKTDPNYRWLDMCDDQVTTIRSGNINGEGGKTIGFGIIHMEYQGPGRDGWQRFYRDLHRRLEAKWPQRMSYIEGEFGRAIERPAWLGPLAEPRK